MEDSGPPVIIQETSRLTHGENDDGQGCYVHDGSLILDVALF